jgi:multiple sugar transport system ATP-binding protein
MNLVEAEIAGDEAVFGQYRVRLDTSRRPTADGRPVILGIRPESFEDAAAARPGAPEIEVTPVVVEELGSDAYVFFPVEAPKIAAETAQQTEDASLLVEDQALFSARVDPRAGGRVGDRLRLAVDPSRFHFFDRETGASLTTVERESSSSEPRETVTAAQ